MARKFDNKYDVLEEYKNGDLNIRELQSRLWKYSQSNDSSYYRICRDGLDLVLLYKAIQQYFPNCDVNYTAKDKVLHVNDK